MPDKEQETYYLEALRRAGVELPVGTPSRPEPPDFLFAHDGPRLGIEFTVFHMPPPAGKRPHQEWQSLKNMTVQLASRLHTEQGGPALYVSVTFCERASLTKRNMRLLAEELAAAVLNAPVPCSSTDHGLEVPYRFLPRGVVSVSLWPSVDGSDRLWDADAGGWILPIDPRHIQDVLKRKSSSEKLARRHCDDLWLVIVNDLSSKAAPAKISGKALGATYYAPFDKVIWLTPDPPRAICLRCEGKSKGDGRKRVVMRPRGRS